MNPIDEEVFSRDEGRSVHVRILFRRCYPVGTWLR